MADATDAGRYVFGFDVTEGLGFSFNRSGVREFIRADDNGVVTHRLFIYQNGASPREIEEREREIIAGDLPRFAQPWMRRDQAERRGNPPPVSSARVPELHRSAGGGGGGGGGGVLAQPDRGGRGVLAQPDRGGRGGGGGGGGFELPEFSSAYGVRRTRKNKNRK